MSVRHVERAPPGDAVGALVFFHGYGGTPEEWLGFLDRIDPKRRFHGYLPEAPYRDPDGGRSWFRRGGTERPEVQLVPVVEWLASARWHRFR